MLFDTIFDASLNFHSSAFLDAAWALSISTCQLIWIIEQQCPTQSSLHLLAGLVQIHWNVNVLRVRCMWMLKTRRKWPIPAFIQFQMNCKRFTKESIGFFYETAKQLRPLIWNKNIFKVFNSLIFHLYSHVSFHSFQIDKYTFLRISIFFLYFSKQRRGFVSTRNYNKYQAKSTTTLSLFFRINRIHLCSRISEIR